MYCDENIYGTSTHNTLTSYEVRKYPSVGFRRYAVLYDGGMYTGFLEVEEGGGAGYMTMIQILARLLL